jgi:hypothetical protein
MDGSVTLFTRLTADAARMLAVETLLADPQALGDDVLESCLYLLRDRLRGGEVGRDQHGEAR